VKPETTPDFELFPVKENLRRAEPERRSDKPRSQSQNATKPFIAWDGEATSDAGYCLFGNSKGEYIRGKELSSLDMLELICESGERNPHAFHISFVFGYDVNHIIKDIGHVRIAVLHKTGTVIWKGYKLRHIPGKSFTVSRLDAKGKVEVSVRIDDIFSYFRGRYDRVLIKHGIGTPEEQAVVTAGKEERADFLWKDIAEIQTYWEMELRLMTQLMDVLRADINAAGFFIGQWHGPGALAAHALKQNKMAQWKEETPDDILDAVRRAYSGGWFERYKVGVHRNKIWTADINSAYTFGISMLPNLANAKWRYVKDPDPELSAQVRFGIFHIDVDPPKEEAWKRYVQTSQGIPAPLFMRDRAGGNSHPISVDGWYWNPEARLVRGDPFARFTEAWILEDDGSYPFAWVEEMYEERAWLKKQGNPAEKALKYTMASLYGRVAQRAGWDEKKRTAPRWHQLDWAGYITSVCRSMLFEASHEIGKQGGLISNDTDGVMSTVPFGELRNGKSAALGAWEMEEFDGVIYVQNGVYWLRKDDEEWWDKHPEEDRNGYPWLKPKMRGIPTGKITRPTEGPNLALEALEGDGIIRYSRHNFVGYGAALQGRWDSWRQWIDQDIELSMFHSGNRQHSSKLCRACIDGKGMTETLHDLALVPSRDRVSEPHRLPWLEPEKESVRDMIRHMLEKEFV
jgi:hypothetical protein